MRKSLSVAALAALAATGSTQVMAGFYIEYPAAVTTSERDLMTNRTHYEQRGEANFRMNDAHGKPAQARYEAAGAKMVVDLGYRVVTHQGTPNNEQRVIGFAENVPFVNAMALVMPKGWQLYQDKGLADERMREPVSFEGNIKWTDALYGVGDSYGYQFEVNWYDRVVKVAQGQPVGAAGAIRIIKEPEPEPPKTREKDKKLLAGADSKDAKAGQGDASAKGDAGKEQSKVIEPGFFLQVKRGTLFENVERLSKENGWKTPKWKIDNDFNVPTDYTVVAKNFEEAMFKLLLIHPIEAEINRIQKIIYVHRELN